MSSCKRCGQCCRLGGPVLHKDDLSLLDRLDAPAKETVPFGMADLVTLRTGELVRDLSLIHICARHPDAS